MKATMGMLLMLPALALAQSDSWNAINCPSGTVDGVSCQYNNEYSVDTAINIFFQVELASGETEGSFTCSNGNTVYCHKAYDATDSGSAGDCFFIVPAGQSYTCQGQGTVNFIGSHESQLSGALVTGQAQSVTCNNGDCSYTNSGSQDVWFSQQIDANGYGRNELSCSYNGFEVCAYAVNGTTGGSSCNFILPAGADLQCKIVSGSFNSQATTTAFGQNVLSANAQAVENFNCPNVTYPNPNYCNCAFQNNDQNDLAVSVVSSSTDNTYNSYHCYIGDTNICAWGSDTNDYGNRGGCYFVLPAGETLTCAMQWGAASFSVSTARSLQGSLWSNSLAAAKKSSPKPLRGAPIEQPVDKTKTLDEQKAIFAKWKAHHGKVYSSEAEEAKRFNNFRKHLTLLKGKTDLPNNLADWSKAEFETHLRGCAFSDNTTFKAAPQKYQITEDDIKNMPESVDWRTKGVVTPVKAQGQCGSCWSFSTTGVLESAWAIAGNGLQSLSEQYLVSCDQTNDGCGGGWPYKAITFLQQNGEFTEASYPYVSGSGTAPSCDPYGHTQAAVQVTGYYNIPQDEEQMAAYVAKYGPLSITVDAMTNLWWPYTGGIMNQCCNHQPDHAVLIVGYGVENGQKYWLIKNSWDAQWGENGYIRLERGSNQCGITVNAPVLGLVEGGVNPPQ